MFADTAAGRRAYAMEAMARRAHEAQLTLTPTEYAVYGLQPRVYGSAAYHKPGGWNAAGAATQATTTTRRNSDE